MQRREVRIGEVDRMGIPIYLVFLHAISDALDNFIHDTAVVAVRLVVSESHHPPALALEFPVNLDDSVIDLFSR